MMWLGANSQPLGFHTKCIQQMMSSLATIAAALHLLAIHLAPLVFAHPQAVDMVTEGLHETISIVSAFLANAAKQVIGALKFRSQMLPAREHLSPLPPRFLSPQRL